MASIADVINQEKFESAHQKVIINLIYSGGWAKNQSTTVLKPFNLTWQQFNLMRILQGQKGKAVPLRTLTERMLDPQSNASRLVDKLVFKGWVERDNCAQDRRQVRLKLSKEGKTILNNASVAIENSYKTFGGDLSTEELNLLSNLLDRYRNKNKH